MKSVMPSLEIPMMTMIERTAVTTAGELIAIEGM